jgi:hypothetical protein
MLFTNQEISTDALPSAAAIELRRLSKSWRFVEMTNTAIIFVLLLMGLLIFYLLGMEKSISTFILIIGGWSLFFALSLYLAWKSWARAGYALREHDILYRRGVYYHTETAIPFNRMQHCEITRGPIERAFDLSTLKVFTAGSSGGDLAIEGLPMKDAQRIKEFITLKIGGRHHPAPPAIEAPENETPDAVN